MNKIPLALACFLFLAACSNPTLPAAPSPASTGTLAPRATTPSSRAISTITQSLSTPVVSPTVNPVEDVQKDAGDGLIAWGDNRMAVHPPFPIAIYNMWMNKTTGLLVYAGNTIDPDQGAVAIVPQYGDLGNPEIVLTPIRVGGLEIIDAKGQRLMLRSYRTNALFFFDIPSRQFVASMAAAEPVTVTPLPTFTPSPTLPVFLSPTASPVGSTPYPGP